MMGVLACTLLLLVPAACDDPTDVGGELIDRQDAGPQRAEIPLGVDTVQFAPITGTASTAAIGAGRFLAGQTTGDPLGEVEATAYIDFARASAPENLATLALDTVEVELVPEYFYGDTTQAATLALYDVEEEWELGRARADTSLADIAESSPITTFEVQPSDTLVTVRLPDAWVREHDDELKTADDSTFSDEFHGFQVRTQDDGSVVGFTSSAASLRAVFEADGEEDAPEAAFILSRQLSTIRQPDAEGPDERFVIQDGTGRALRFSLNLPDSLRNAAVNNATIFFEVDSTLAAAGSDFARPQLDALELYSVPSDAGASGGCELNEGAQVQRLPGTPRFTLDADSSRFQNSFPLINLVQQRLLGTSGLECFEVRPALQTVQTPIGQVSVPVPSLSSALIRRDEDHRPRLVITYTPTEE